jgi:DNA-directed RNA polymerase specialized sigma24 family protein
MPSPRLPSKIARLLGQPLDTVKSTFYRAMSALREKTGLSP